MENKKIAIVSFVQADNYGALLQNYALQKMILGLGYEAWSLYYRCPEIEETYSPIQRIQGLLIFRNVKNSIKNIINIKSSNAHSLAFKRFRKEYLNITDCLEYHELNSPEHVFDVYICGSDQIWNVNLIGNKIDNIDVFTLGFVTDKPKGAYGASCGSIANLNQEILDRINQLDIITAREKSLSRFLETSLSRKVTIVCDPVMLLAKGQWMELIRKERPRKYKTRYLFLYFNNHADVCEVAKFIKKEKKLEILCPCRKNKYSMLSVTYTYESGPAEFLRDLYYADMVVASSFHAVVFSVIFEKKFVAVINNKKDQRIHDFLKMAGLSQCMVCGLEDYKRKYRQMQEVNYHLVKERIRKWRIDSINELRELCS